MIKKLTNNLMFLSSICLILTSLTAFSLQARKITTGYSFRIEQAENETKIYLDGDNLDKVKGADIYLLPNSDANIISAEMGGFIENTITIRWDLAKGQYSFVKNPETIIKNNIDEPLLVLVTKNKKPIMMLPNSLIYVSGVGGIYPNTN